MYTVATKHAFLHKLNIGQRYTIYFSAIHFRGESIRQVSYYTILSGFRLPWPPSCCSNRPTPFQSSSR